MEIAPDLVRRLNRLRLGGLLVTLPDRATHARQAKLNPLEFVGRSRMRSTTATARAWSAGLRPPASTSWWPTSSSSGTPPVSYDRARVRDLFGLHWLTAQENVIFCGAGWRGQCGRRKPAAWSHRDDEVEQHPPGEW
jgi:hypothetical protein